MISTHLHKFISSALCLLLAAWVSLTALRCATGGGVIEFDYSTTREGTTDPSMLSGVKIQDGRTYQVYFAIEEPERCIRIDLEGFIIQHTIKGDRYKKVNSYLVVEKQVDITRFNINRNTVYSEIGRNYDLNWFSKESGIYCTVQGDPIQHLGKGLYRIRFTAFRDEEIRYRISLYSNRKKLKFR